MSLSLNDIRHLDAAAAWLERGDYVNCFNELDRIDCKNAEEQRVLALRWKLYDSSRLHVSAASIALTIQRRFPDEPQGYVWRAISLTKLGCTQEAYDDLTAVAGKFDGLAVVPYTLAVLAARLQRMELAGAWLVKAYHTPDGRETKMVPLEGKGTGHVVAEDWGVLNAMTHRALF